MGIGAVNEGIVGVLTVCLSYVLLLCGCDFGLCLIVDVVGCFGGLLCPTAYLLFFVPDASGCSSCRPAMSGINSEKKQ